MRLPRVRFMMRRMMGVTFGLMLAGCLILGPGCSPEGTMEAARSGGKGPGQESVGRPTIAEAKEALLALLRTNEPLYDLRRVDAEELSRQAEQAAGADGKWYWGPFLINLRTLTYEYTIAYGTKCALGHGGKFEARGGRWFALPPGS